MKKTITFIVVANGSRAKFFINEGPGKGLMARAEFNMSEESHHVRDIQADKPGRTFDRAGGQRHAMEYSSDPQDVEKAVFAKKIADRLEGAFQDAKFDRIIIAASPHMLAELRKFIASSLQSKIYAEIDKDLTQIPGPDLPPHFSEVLAL